MKNLTILVTLLIMGNAFAADVNSGKPIGQSGTGAQIVVIKLPGGSGQEGTGTDGGPVVKKPGDYETSFLSVSNQIHHLSGSDTHLSKELEMNLVTLMNDEALQRELSLNNNLQKEEILLEMVLEMSGIELTELSSQD